MRRLAVVAAVLLAGCGQNAHRAANESNLAANVPAAVADSSAPAANVASAASNAVGALPPADSPLRFVGLWATSEANCTAKPWRFTENKLTATDGPKCSIYKVTKAPGGFDLAATCPGKKPVETDLIRLRFAESARAMLVESNAIPPTGLIYCGKES
jgi:hypothetical protein